MVIRKIISLTGKLRNLNWNSHEKPYMLGGGVGVRRARMSPLHLQESYFVESVCTLRIPNGYSPFRISAECVGVSDRVLLIGGGRETMTHKHTLNKRWGECGHQACPC